MALWETIINSGTEAERDETTPAAGWLWANTDTDNLERYNGSTWVVIANNEESVGAVPDYILIRDEKAADTPGGTFTSGAWRTRDLTSEVSDAGGHASLSSNQITLAAGTYRCRISAPASKVARHKAILYNVTDTSTELVGSSAYSGTTDNNTTESLIVGRFTIADAKVFEVRHRCETTNNTFGFGVDVNFDSEVEVYTIAEFWKEA